MNFFYESTLYDNEVQSALKIKLEILQKDRNLINLNKDIVDYSDSPRSIRKYNQVVREIEMTGEKLYSKCCKKIPQHFSPKHTYIIY